MPSAWTVLANIARRDSTAARTRRQLLAGTGKDQVHLLVVCTGERGLCGGFNSSIVRLAREHAAVADGAGQDGQDLLRRPQGQRAS
jgi:F-type H+-transporting ATPase subunit gamma